MAAIEPTYVALGVTLGIGAIGWLSKVHYDLIQLRRDGRTAEAKALEIARAVEFKSAEIRHHYDDEISRMRAEIGNVRAESQNGVSALKDSLNKLELRIETGFASIIEQIKSLFKDQDKH